jgi:hypothetical protein
MTILAGSAAREFTDTAAELWNSYPEFFLRTDLLKTLLWNISEFDNAQHLI